MMKKAPDFWHTTPPSWLQPLSWLYNYAGRIRHACTTPHKMTVPVICVGNVVAGGAGKTPVVIALATYLIEAGYTPHILTRGYGGAITQPTRVNHMHTSADVGDEALLLAIHAPCWVSANRRASAHCAITEGADILLMDDGFQNPSLHKDISLIVIDGGYGFGNKAVIPAGCLREPITQAWKRADAVVMIGKDTHFIIPTIPKNLILLRGTIQPIIPDNLKEKCVLAFCGIGRPQKFYDTLKEHHVQVVETQDFADHHPFTQEEMQQLKQRATAHNALLITTEKDWVRLNAVWKTEIDFIPITLKLEPQALLKKLMNQL